MWPSTVFSAYPKDEIHIGLCTPSLIDISETDKVSDLMKFDFIGRTKRAPLRTQTTIQTE